QNRRVYPSFERGGCRHFFDDGITKDVSCKANYGYAGNVFCYEFNEWQSKTIRRKSAFTAHLLIFSSQSSTRNLYSAARPECSMPQEGSSSDCLASGCFRLGAASSRIHLPLRSYGYFVQWPDRR